MAKGERPRRPTRVILDKAAKEVADNVAKAYAGEEPVPRRPNKPKKGKRPGMSEPGARHLTAESLTETKPVTARAHAEAVETPKVGIIYGGKCKRCDQAVRVHIKAIEGTFQLMNFYDIRCACKGQVALHLIGPMTHLEFAGLQPTVQDRTMKETPDAGDA